LDHNRSFINVESSDDTHYAFSLRSLPLIEEFLVSYESDMLPDVGVWSLEKADLEQII